jgi:hypothetical protein
LRFLKKLDIELPYIDPAIPLLHIYPKECKSVYKRGMFIAALFTTPNTEAMKSA